MLLTALPRHRITRFASDLCSFALRLQLNSASAPTATATPTCVTSPTITTTFLARLIFALPLFSAALPARPVSIAPDPTKVVPVMLARTKAVSPTLSMSTWSTPPVLQKRHPPGPVVRRVDPPVPGFDTNCQSGWPGRTRIPRKSDYGKPLLPPADPVRRSATKACSPAPVFARCSPTSRPFSTASDSRMRL